MKKHIKWNSPMVLSFVFASALALGLNYVTNGLTNGLLFSVYRGSLSDPLFYVRLFLNDLGHANAQHYINNMMMILLVGPLLEEKYGAKNLLSIIVAVALVTGIAHIFIQGDTMLLGASGVVFAFILLASITGERKGGQIPITFILVALFYIGQQVYEGLFLQDNVSQITHILGGFLGALYGLVINRK
ncbi:MAG: rhomboid family intramembrane serine protease [Solobacterium sp.]|nr:rhomboid family intramembrane serine protease [Solobacterium sp.]